MVHQKHFPLHKPQLDIERKKSSWPGQLSLAKKHPLLYAFVALPLLLPPPPLLEDGGGVVQFRAPLPTPQPVGRTICSERARGRSYTAIRCKNPPYVGKIRGFRGGGGVLTRQSVSPNQTPDLGLLFRENPRI